MQIQKSYLTITVALAFAIAPITTTSAKISAREVASMGELKTHLASKLPVVIMFYAPWCGACNAMKEPFNRVCDLLKKDALFIRINAEDEKLKEALDQFGIEAVPTFVVKHVGMMDQDQLSTAIHCLLKKPSMKPKEAQQKAPPAAKKAAPTSPKKAPLSPARKAGSLTVAKLTGNKPLAKKVPATAPAKKAPIRQNGRKA